MVKPGYKTTESGVIPEDWECTLLLDKSKLLNGLTYTPDNVKDHGLFVLRSSNIQNNQLSFEDTLYVDCIVDDEKKIKDGDILICVRNGSAALIGKSAQAHRDYDATFGAFMAVLRGEHNDYIHQILQQGIIQREISKNSGATINQITNGDFKQIRIALPTSRDEEVAVTTTLSHVDRLISTIEKLIAKKKAIKQGTMQELLTGKKRLPGFSDKWKQRSFSDACEICARMVDPTQTEYANLPHIGNESIEKFTGRITHYNKVKEDQLISGKYLFGSNDVLYGKINPHFAKAAFPMFEGLCSADMYPISCKEDILPEYLLYILLSTEFTNYTVSLSKRSGIPKVNRDELADYMMLLPSVDEQKEIANVLCGMDLEIHSLIQKLTKYRQVKQGMMQQLLTGKIRLV